MLEDGNATPKNSNNNETNRFSDYLTEWLLCFVPEEAQQGVLTVKQSSDTVLAK
jgi:hypothetical protein